jgi:hypothetical protein
MAVKEVKKEARDPRAILAMVGLLLGLLVLGGVIYWLVKPSSVRTVTLKGEAAKEAAESATAAPGPPLPPTQPLPSAPDPGPTLVTIDLKNASADDAVQALSKQANVPIQFNSNQQGMLATLLQQRGDVSIKNQPFWAAYYQLCKQLNLTPLVMHDEGNRNTIALTSGDPTFTKLPMSMVGSFMLVTHGVTSRFDTDLIGSRPPSRDLAVSMTVYAEPKLSAYRIAPVATVEQAVDENGVSLLSPRDPNADRWGGQRQSNWRGDVQCRLLFPKNAGQRIARLKGYVSVVTAGKPETITIKDPLKARNLDNKVDGQLVRLVQLQKQGSNSYRAQFATDANSPVAKEWDNIRNVATLHDANGRKFQDSGTSLGGGRANSIEFGLYFNGESGIGAPAEMKVTWPTAIKEIRVPFEFSDLPLPH